jgi:hypothetical protein
LKANEKLFSDIKFGMNSGTFTARRIPLAQVALPNSHPVAVSAKHFVASDQHSPVARVNNERGDSGAPRYLENEGLPGLDSLLQGDGLRREKLLLTNFLYIRVMPLLPS